MTEETVVVKSLQLPEVRTALLITDGDRPEVPLRPGVADRPEVTNRPEVPERPYRPEVAERIIYKRERPAPPPRRISLQKYDEKQE